MHIVRRRIDKLSHSDTVLYEISMLRFTAGRLIREQWEHERDAWVYLEAFLLHYRNLVEFLSNPNPRQTGPVKDIHLKNVWALEQQAAPSWVTEICNKAQFLWAKYGEGADEKISRYLQHCTTQRIRKKDWLIDEMMADIEPFLVAVQPNLKPAEMVVEPIGPVTFLGPHSASTTVATITAAAIPMILPDSLKDFE
jgi:hypothetical protein